MLKHSRSILALLIAFMLSLQIAASWHNAAHQHQSMLEQHECSLCMAYAATPILTTALALVAINALLSFAFKTKNKPLHFSQPIYQFRCRDPPATI